MPAHGRDNGCDKSNAATARRDMPHFHSTILIKVLTEKASDTIELSQVTVM
jgi:hypothetical protein